MKLTLIVALSLTATLMSAAEDRPFLLHVNADGGNPSNCASAEWSSPIAYCYGSTAPSGHSYNMSSSRVSVSWCSPSAACDLAKGRPMPGGYVRWMKFCKLIGDHDCSDWLVGAVQMPNGPFHVIDGKINGVAVQPDNGNQGMVRASGGPLHLNVQHMGTASNGGGKPSSQKYVFVLTGRIKF